MSAIAQPTSPRRVTQLNYMKTITVLAYRRPYYLHRCLSALEECAGLEGWKVVISLDAPPEPNHPWEPEIKGCKDVALAWKEEMDLDEGGPLVQVLQQESHLGVADHPVAAYDAVFGMGSAFNVALEEDALLAPDALLLVNWFRTNLSCARYLLLNLARVSKMGGAPAVVCEQARLDCPWAWAFRQRAWEAIRPLWNSKKHPPIGWDWSLTYQMWKHGWTALTPALNRAQNIGADAGEHGTREYWEKNLRDLPMAWADVVGEWVPGKMLGTGPLVMPMEEDEVDPPYESRELPSRWEQWMRVELRGEQEK